MKNGKLLGILCIITIISGIIAGGCASQPAPTTTTSQTLKIGLIEALNWPIGLDTLHAVTMDIEKINKNGGLDIGGQKYIIDLIVDDDKMDEAATKTAAQKQIFQDKVRFIMTDQWNEGSFSLFQDNKILTILYPLTNEMYNPKYTYFFRGAMNDTNFVSVIPYTARKLPNLKTYVGVFPDRQDGRGYGAIHELAAKNSGLKVLEQIYYPATATDLSAVGTRIKQLNPDILSPHGGGPPGDSIVLKAAYDAGWRGQAIGPATIPGETMMGIAGAAAIEGMISIGWPEEFEPATTAMAREFKADWIAKYGKYEQPEIVAAIKWWMLKAALQQSGSTDPDKVAAVLANGMKFESPGGTGQMIARPDLGNNRTVGTIIGDMPVKQIVGGKVKQIDTMTVPVLLDLVKTMYAWK